MVEQLCIVHYALLINLMRYLIFTACLNNMRLNNYALRIMNYALLINLKRYLIFTT